MPQFAPLEQEEAGESSRKREGAWNWKLTLLWAVIAGVLLIFIFDRQAPASHSLLAAGSLDSPGVEGVETSTRVQKHLKAISNAVKSLPECLSELSKRSTEQEKGRGSYKFVNYIGNGSELEHRFCAQVTGLHPAVRHSRKQQLVQVLTYNNEEDMLHARFLEHYDFFDVFVVVESPLSFAGKPKELYFDKEVCKRFAPFTPKVVHVVLNNTEELLGMASSSLREAASRDVILPVARLLELRPDDLVLYSDTDEVPSTAALTRGAYMLWSTLSNRLTTEHNRFSEDRLIPAIYFTLDLYYYSLYHYQGPWDKTVKLFPYELLRRCGLQQIRSRDCDDVQVLAELQGSGVHCSYFLTPEDISRTIKSQSHSEYNLPKFTDVGAIKERIRSNSDLFDRGTKLIRRDPLFDQVLSTFAPEARTALLDLSNKLRKLQE